MNTLGQRIENLREVNYESMDTVAKAIGTTVPNYRQLEQNNITKPDVYKIMALCRHFDVSIETLFPEWPKTSDIGKDRERAASYTGLSFKALDHIYMNMKNPAANNALNRLLENDWFYVVLRMIDSYLTEVNYKSEPNDETKKAEALLIDHGLVSFQLKDIAKYERQEVLEQFSKVLMDISGENATITDK